MKTLFELKQTDLSSKTGHVTEIRVFENGSLEYSVSNDHGIKALTKSENSTLAKRIGDLIIRNKSIIDDIEPELNDGSRIGYRYDIKLGKKSFYGNELARIFSEEDIVGNAEAENSIIQIIDVARKYIDNCYPDFINWNEINSQWFRKRTVSNYCLDDKNYTVIDNDVYYLEEDGTSRRVEDISLDQLRMYGECSDPWMIELKILDIKVHEEPDWNALITGKDGAGIEIAFWDNNYFDHPENYEIGKIGCYAIWGDIQNEPKPIREKQGVYLEAAEEQIYKDYICGEKNIHGQRKGKKFIDYPDFSLFEKTENFLETGVYYFRTVVGQVLYNSDESAMGFEMPLMNQILKESPRRISVQFDLDNPYTGEFEMGDGLKGLIKFFVADCSSENIGRYGDNETLSFDEKYSDFSEWDWDDDE